MHLTQTNKMKFNKTNQTIEVEINPHELASIFWAMNSEEQAMFFNSLGMNQFSNIIMQMQAITDESILADRGRVVMELFGTYSEKTNN